MSGRISGGVYLHPRLFAEPDSGSNTAANTGTDSEPHCGADAIADGESDSGADAFANASAYPAPLQGW